MVEIRSLRDLKKYYLGTRLKVEDLIDENQYEDYSDEGEGWYHCEIKDYDMVNTYSFNVKLVNDVLIDVRIGSCEHLESEDATRCTFSRHRVDRDTLCEIESRLERAAGRYSEEYGAIVCDALRDVVTFWDCELGRLRKAKSIRAIPESFNRYQPDETARILIVWLLMDQAAGIERRVALKRYDLLMAQMMAMHLPRGWAKRKIGFINGQPETDIKQALLLRHPLHEKSLVKALSLLK